MRNAQRGFCRIHFVMCYRSETRLLLERLFQQAEQQCRQQAAAEQCTQKAERISHYGQQKQSTVGGGAAAAEEDGQKACQRTAGNAGGADTQRVAQGEGQRALRHEGKAHDRSLGHAAALRGGESCREQHTGQRQPHRWDHAARHDGSHKIILQVDQCQCAADIGGFIDRPAVVGGHHAAQ